MLSPSTLERVSVAYRRGYYDGYYARPRFCEVKPEYIKPFADYDYEQGYHAGENDAKWERRDDERRNQAVTLSSAKRISF